MYCPNCKEEQSGKFCPECGAKLIEVPVAGNNQNKFKNESIKQVCEKIDNNLLLIPAIQRPFVWQPEQIENLFDSIMRGYPINTMIFWAIRRQNLKVFKETKFYQFIRNFKPANYRDNSLNETASNKLNENNPTLWAAIDGQQRLNSLYIGLYGSFTQKQKGAWSSTEKAWKEYFLTLGLQAEIDLDNTGKKYDFKFLLEKDITEHHVRINKVLEYGYLNELKERYANHQEIIRTLDLLENRLNDQNIINYYQEDSQNLETVLDIFIRTNNGGKPLTKTDLLMATLQQSWPKAEENFKKLIKTINGLPNTTTSSHVPKFNINKDVIIKCALMIFSKHDVSTKVEKFHTENISKLIEENWNKLQESINQTFIMLSAWHLDGKSLRAYNAVVPIVYFIYKHDLQNKINAQGDESQLRKLKAGMCQWLMISLLKNVFSGQPDNTLKTLRDIIDKKNTRNEFIFQEALAAFSGTTKSLKLDDDYIAKLITTPYSKPSECYLILALVYSLSNVFTMNKWDMDHLHPHDCFVDNGNKGEKLKDLISEDEYKRVIKENLWNTVLNLQLLDGSLNRKRHDMSLKDFVQQSGIRPEDRFLPSPTEASLELKEFSNFIIARKRILTDALKKVCSGQIYIS